VRIPIHVPIDRVWLPIRVGVRRQVNAIYNARRDRYGGEEGDAWGKHIGGAIAECEVAHYLGLAWNAEANQPGVADVAPFVEVRSTALRDGCLILHQADSDNARFILVVGEIPNLEIAGFVRKGDIADIGRYRRVRGWNGQRSAYFVPQSELRPMDEFEL
jgi:hypothetical protein